MENGRRPRMDKLRVQRQNIAKTGRAAWDIAGEIAPVVRNIPGIVLEEFAGRAADRRMRNEQKKQ